MFCYNLIVTAYLSSPPALMFFIAGSICFPHYSNCWLDTSFPYKSSCFSFSSRVYLSLPAICSFIAFQVVIEVCGHSPGIPEFRVKPLSMAGIACFVGVWWDGSCYLSLTASQVWSGHSARLHWRLLGTDHPAEAGAEHLFSYHDPQGTWR